MVIIFGLLGPKKLLCLNQRLLVTLSLIGWSCSAWTKDCLSHSLRLAEAALFEPKIACHTFSDWLKLLCLNQRLLDILSQTGWSGSVWTKDCFLHFLWLAETALFEPKIACHSLSDWLKWLLFEPKIVCHTFSDWLKLLCLNQRLLVTLSLIGWSCSGQWDQSEAALHSWTVKCKMCRIIAHNDDFKLRIWGCTCGGVYVPCIYTQARWELL